MTAAAETLDSALSSAYGDNPTLNAQRAAVRAVDEKVRAAKSGCRPTVTGFGSSAGGSISQRSEAPAPVRSGCGHPSRTP